MLQSCVVRHMVKIRHRHYCRRLYPGCHCHCFLGLQGPSILLQDQLEWCVLGHCHYSFDCQQQCELWLVMYCIQEEHQQLPALAYTEKQFVPMGHYQCAVTCLVAATVT